MQSRLPIASAQFDSFVRRLAILVEDVDGQLTEREIAFLALLAAVPTCEGEVLEIGSFKGRSAIVLARAASLAGQGPIVAVDPLDCPSITDPSLGGKASAWDDFQSNLKAKNVEKLVEFHHMRAEDLARLWPAERKIRLLWIDGDHTYAGAKRDFDCFSKFLADGAIVAMHDVLHHHGGPARVFAEDMLLASCFGPAGACGSIGWSQFFRNEAHARKYRSLKLNWYRRLSRLIPFVAFGGDIEGWDKVGYKLARAGIPHGSVRPSKWISQVVFPAVG